MYKFLYPAPRIDNQKTFPYDSPDLKIKNKFIHNYTFQK